MTKINVLCLFIHYRSVFKKENQKSARSAVQLKYVDETVKSVEDQMWERFSRMCQDVDIRDNFYLSWFVRAKRGFNPEASPNYAPPFLTEEGFIALKVKLESLNNALTCVCV